MFKTIATVVAFFFISLSVQSQNKIPCSNPVYRSFDFWIGEWEVFGKQNNKAGDSKISNILDSCVIFEEWVSQANPSGGFRYSGKSFNTYNNSTKQWQQTWVDNTGSTTEYLQGVAKNNSIIFNTNPFKFSKDSLAIRRLSFYKIDENTVRQHGEISKDNGLNWSTEYDLIYRRKK